MIPLLAGKDRAVLFDDQRKNHDKFGWRGNLIRNLDESCTDNLVLQNLQASRSPKIVSTQIVMSINNGAATNHAVSTHAET